MSDANSNNLDKVKERMISSPKRIPETFQWVIDKALELYYERKKFAKMYKVELEVLSEASSKLNVGNNLIVVDLCSGLSKTTPLMMQKLIENNPDRKIYFIPIDVCDIILSWKTYLEENYPNVASHIVDIKPVCTSALDAVMNIEEFIDAPYQDWEVVFSLFGPTTNMFEETRFQDIVKEIGKFINGRGSGGFLLTFVHCYYDDEVRMIWKDYYDVLQVPGFTECILLGFNKEIGANIDPKKFEPKLEYVRNESDDVFGMWAGFLLKAVAKDAMTIKCEKLGIEVNVEKGEEIWISEGSVTNMYYHEKYLEALANLASLSMSQMTTHDYMKAGYMSL